MFKILIVEDDNDKLREILQFLETIDTIDVDTIDTELDSLGAKKKLKEKHYDLLILDIGIPLRKSEAVDLEGGLKLLNEIQNRSGYKVPTHIIGLTGREKVFEKAQKEFEQKILSIIYYSPSNIEWQTKLIDGVKQRITAKISQSAIEPEYDYDIAIITAVSIEFNAVKKLPFEWKKINIPNDSTEYLVTVFERDLKSFRVVAACQPQMGMNASSVLSMKLIYNFRPRYLFMCGIAASIKEIETHGFGDVLVIDETWDGGAGKITEDTSGNLVFLQTANHLRLNTDLSEKMRSLKEEKVLLRKIKDQWQGENAPNTELNIHIGSISSVAGVVENQAIINELKLHDRKLLGLEMEAYGVYYAANNCSNPKPTPIVLKSVTDFANTSKQDKYQPYAAYTSANVMLEYILSKL